MSKPVKKAAELLSLLNAELRKYDACAGVTVDRISPISDERIEYTWTASVLRKSAATVPGQCSLTGHCLDPAFKEGDKVVFDREAPLENGCFACFYYRPELVRPGHLSVALKKPRRGDRGFFGSFGGAVMVRETYHMWNVEHQRVPPRLMGVQHTEYHFRP